MSSSTELADACREALPVLAQHIDTSHRQIEQAITALSEKFAAITERLDGALAVRGEFGGSDDDLGQTLAAGQAELAAVVTALKQINANRATLSDDIRRLVECTRELNGMADEVSQIAFKTNMLSLNAAIEAAHAGEAGKGFGVVAQEVRSLSQASRETGQRINERIAALDSALSDLCGRNEASLADEARTVAQCEANIQGVLTRFGVTSVSLAQTSEQLRSESATIKTELEESLVHMQFQDRVSQILQHTAKSLRALAQGAGASEIGTVEPLADIVTHMSHGYTTAEQRAAHRGEVVEEAKVGGITYF